ncbi:hypothetical protein [Corynebacterium sp. HMSC29G08]|uniref:hypothetical protein n=1 Tax=Corynebacterium sp. HMSC29G08 TaxID=1581069 RepID=UPI0008A4C089|nr:hypothetical protein [Corynebacterium sp. HMSC29G08]OFT82261.1 hypothetical protein HMPREF3101_08310 [Corynebacterium sp. HMSC29G08]
MTGRDTGQFENDATPQAEHVNDTDAFLDSLGRGVDPSDGADPLAGLFLDLRAEVEQPMPDAPSVEHVSAPKLTAIDGGRAEATAKRRTFGGSASPKQMNPWAAGLIGAAAASALVVGGGVAFLDLGQGSSLREPSTSMSSGNTAAIELASTLEEIEVASQGGDADYLEQLLIQARELVDAMAVNNADAQPAEEHVQREEKPAEPPHTVTETVTVAVTVTQTETVNQPVPSSQTGTPSSSTPTPTQSGQPGQPGTPGHAQDSQSSQPESQPGQPGQPSPGHSAPQNPQPDGQPNHPGGVTVPPVVPAVPGQ